MSKSKGSRNFDNDQSDVTKRPAIFEDITSADSDPDESNPPGSDSGDGDSEDSN